MFFKNQNTPPRRFIILSVTFGIISTVFKYEGFGANIRHISQLPLIIRAVDNTYLVNDFYVNEASSSIARIGFAQFIASLTSMLGGAEYLPFLYLLITLLSNIAVAVITFLFARKLFGGSNLSGIIASAFVVSVSTFSLGYCGQLYLTTLFPRTIALPLVLLAIFTTLFYGRLIWGVILCGIAAYFQPLYGLLFGGLLLLSFFIAEVLDKRTVSREILKQMLFPIITFVGYTSVSIIPQISQETISSDQFIYVLAFFRAPLHYVPSSFSVADYVTALSFLFASGLAWHRWEKTHNNSSVVANRISILVASTFVLCLGGYVFVEIIPSRIWTTIQAFRLLIIVKWLGLIFLGGMVADFIQNRERATAGLYIVSILLPVFIGISAFLETVVNWAKKKFPHRKGFFNICPVLESKWSF